MLNLNGKTILTSEVEKQFIQIGGAERRQVYTETQLSQALSMSIERVAEAGRFDVLEKIYEAARKRNPELPPIEDIEVPD